MCYTIFYSFFFIIIFLAGKNPGKGGGIGLPVSIVDDGCKGLAKALCGFRRSEAISAGRYAIKGKILARASRALRARSARRALENG